MVNTKYLLHRKGFQWILNALWVNRIHTTHLLKSKCYLAFSLTQVHLGKEGWRHLFSLSDLSHFTFKAVHSDISFVFQIWSFLGYISPKDRKVTSMPWCDIDVMSRKPPCTLSQLSCCSLDKQRGTYEQWGQMHCWGDLLQQKISFHSLVLEKKDLEPRNMALHEFE